MSSNNYCWKKHDEELGAVVTGPRTRKPSKKYQTDSTDESSPLQNPILKPKAETKTNQYKRKNDESYTKRVTKKLVPTNQVANYNMKPYLQKGVLAPASTSDLKTQDTTNMLGSSDGVE